MIGKRAQRFARAAERPALAYALVVAAVVAAAAGRLASGLLLPDPPPFLFFFPAILFATLVAGARGGVLAVLLSAATLATLFQPLGAGGENVAGAEVRLGLFVVVAVLMVVMARALRRIVLYGVEAEERFRAAQEAALDPFVIAEPIREGGQVVDYRWVYANPAADRTAPAAWRRLTGQRVSTVFPPADAALMIARLNDVLQHGGPDDVRVRRMIDGEEHWMRSSGVRLRDSVAVTYRDVTAELRAEQELRESRRSLEERVAERTRELEASLEMRARTEASLAQAQRLETVGRLTGGVAHDFNNLLTVVIGGLDMILRAPGDVARVRRLGEAALAAAQRGERLTRQLLAFARRQELKLEAADVAALIREVEPLMRQAAGEGRDLILDCDPVAGACRLDGAQFEAALLNLVVNAVDATRPGGRLVIRSEPARLAAGEVAGVMAGTYVRVSVADDGAGMSPDVLERVFEPFFTTKEVGKGTGLGLAQVYGFVAQCGGGVAVDSGVGQGTTVSLYLPTAEAPAAPPRVEASPAPDLAAGGRRVLLVEDDASVRLVAETLLREMGCVVACEADGASALRRLHDGESFDLLISDVVMPGGMSGIDLARAAETARPGLPVVLTTGYAGDQAEAGAGELPWPVLRKPFRLDQLAAMLRPSLASTEA